MIDTQEHHPIIDLATGQQIGYMGDEYLNTKARIGLAFFSGGSFWRIIQVEEEGSPLVLQYGDGAFPPDLGIKAPIAASDVAASQPANLTKPNVILVEAYKRYLVIHTSCGERTNRTLSWIFDAILTEQDLVRDIWHDGLCVLILTPATLTKGELGSTASDLLRIAPTDAMAYLGQHIHAVLPLEGEAELHLTSIRRSRAPQSHSQRPGFGELRTRFASLADLDGIRSIFEKIASKELLVAPVFSGHSPTPATLNAIRRYSEWSKAETSMLIRRNSSRLKKNVMNALVALTCINCGAELPLTPIRAIPGRPVCPQCHSGMLALRHRLQPHLKMRVKEQKVTPTPVQGSARQVADLVLAYGREAIISLSVGGVGPETASRILSRMPANIDQLSEELLRAKLNYAVTRPFWKKEHHSFE